MKRFIIFSLVIISLAVVVVLLLRKKNDNISEPVNPAKRNGVAVILTGAAARIPQEAALLEELDNRGLLKNLVFISGVSSGALNSVILNGILSGKMSWTDYRKDLADLKNSDIFIQEEKKIPVNTSPARALFTKLIEEKLGYREIGQLPVTTSISFTHVNEIDLKKTIYRMCSRKINNETDTSLNLVDIVMASTAFPLIFPPVKISNVTTIPDLKYIDGGVGEDHVPFQALLEFEKFRGSGVEKVYIVSRKADSNPDISEELKSLGINDKGMFDRLGISLDAILQKGIVNRLKAFATEDPELLPLTYIWIPEFKEDFMLFNFDNLEQQYELTSTWAKTHHPVPLAEYLLSCSNK